MVRTLSDTVYRAGTQVRAEFLIAENSQAFFQTELEPVAAGHTVTGSVMEIFMADNAFDLEVIFIGCGVGTRQHIFGVKDVKTFISIAPC